MSDKSPKPQEPDTDVHDDPDEPAFEWMKPASSGATSAAGNSAPADAATKAQPASSTGSQPAASTGSQPAAPTGTQPESRAGRKAAEAAETEPEPPLFAGSSPAGKPTGGASHSEPLPTSALQVRPPEEEVARRNAEREQAAKVKPLSRFILTSRGRARWHWVRAGDAQEGGPNAAVPGWRETSVVVRFRGGRKRS